MVDGCAPNSAQHRIDTLAGILALPEILLRDVGVPLPGLTRRVIRYGVTTPLSHRVSDQLSAATRRDPLPALPSRTRAGPRRDGDRLPRHRSETRSSGGCEGVAPRAVVTAWQRSVSARDPPHCANCSTRTYCRYTIPERWASSCTTSCPSYGESPSASASLASDSSRSTRRYPSPARSLAPSTMRTARAYSTATSSPRHPSA